jgi:hypothetical protein
LTVAIVVLNYNGTEDTLECLRSLRGIAFPDARIYLVDNGSTPPLRPSLPASLPGVSLLESPVNLGYTGGCLLGSRAALRAGADHVLFLNNDTVVDPGFLEPLLRALEADPRLGIVTPKIYFQGRDRVVWAHGARFDPLTGRSTHIGVYRTDTGQYDRIRDVGRVTGCAMMVRRSFIEEVGPLDDRFFAYGEELDWCLRARRKGFRLAVVPESVIWHKGHRTSGRLGRPFVAYLQSRNHLLLIRKNAECFVAGGAPALAYFALAMGYRLLASSRPAACAAARGVWDGLRGRFGPPPADLLGGAR